MDLHPVFRPSVPTDGQSILAIMDACVEWMNTRTGGGQWGPQLFSAAPGGGAGWTQSGGGDVVHEGTGQRFVLEVDDWEEANDIDMKEGRQRRVGGWVGLSTKHPRYVPKHPTSHIYISTLAIHPAVHHRGLGAVFISSIKALAHQRDGAQLLRLDCWGGNTAGGEEGKTLIEAWERLGFVRKQEVGPDGEARGEKGEEKPWVQVMELWL
ncbi:hypothetical protein GGX14DRAFT_693278 [Mycena pura]|uniref:N-acetyltransferase domain-containing protein n=1 Tax=Mycena pura TaxID=153505 RepID=A0AAD6YRZ8_9AGAR|nr:hypothetical protein GGX14DRAFT_693278 [Mycena pura]